MERKLAQLLSEVSTRRRMWRRATVAAGNSMVQVWLRSLKGCVCVCGGGDGKRERAVLKKQAEFSCKWEVPGENSAQQMGCSLGQPLNVAASQLS